MILVYFLETISIVSLVIGAVLTFKKYFDKDLSKVQDFYLLLGICLMLIYYLIHFILLILNIYNPHLMNLAYAFKTYSFWGFCSFFLSQMFFNNPKTFKILKFILFLSFLLVVNILWSFTCFTNSVVFEVNNNFLKLSLLQNKYSDFLYELIWLISSICIMLWIRKFTHMRVKELYFSAVFAITSYMLDLFNLIRFEGINYPLFIISYLMGTTSLLFMIIVVFAYFKEEKKVLIESKNRLIKAEKSLKEIKK